MEVRRSEHKNHQSCYNRTLITEKTDAQISGFESDIGACWRRPLNRCLCVILLDGREGLEEFGQVNLRVAAGGQSFVWHFLQPPIHFFLCFPLACTNWRWQKERKEGLALLELSGRSFSSSAASKSIQQAACISNSPPSLWLGSTGRGVERTSALSRH